MAKKALHITKGVKNAPSVNPKLRAGKRWSRSVAELAKDIIDGNLPALAQGITLVESNAVADKENARALLHALMPHTGSSFRIGVTGVPGVGKSTFLESYGSALLKSDETARVAVLAVDPSSEVSKGSILGDKTRMMELGKHERAFIRPSSSGGNLGGVAKKTREALLLCEAAGFNYIFVETVGVGQSETLVAQLVDCFLFLAMPGTGDELQGLKKGIMEMADIIAINKSEPPNTPAGERSALAIRSALQLFTNKKFDWHPPVLLTSGLTGFGFNELDASFDRYRRHSQSKGWFDKKRKEQQEYWFEHAVRDGVFELLRKDEDWKKDYEALKAEVALGNLNPFEASAEMVKSLKGKV
ncbi:methylmalonyl Co-A mutase-associated GTPase MeaB [Schleiferiaceae bacterium]|jgi:LAO/AO transport system kinase|nr:methylmalonyl Co-A mutase-associated GTPase MeaB [Schleiferiaceae bacterium]